MRILLAEDEPAMAEAIAAFLEYHQYTVDWVSDGLDALHQATEQAYDGLVLDLSNTVDSLPQIAPERLLDRFTRGDTARSRKTGGTGIGLSTAKSVADMCHGDITVSCPESSMFQVVVRLPLSAMP